MKIPCLLKDRGDRTVRFRQVGKLVEGNDDVGLFRPHVKGQVAARGQQTTEQADDQTFEHRLLLGLLIGRLCSLAYEAGDAVGHHAEDADKDSGEDNAGTEVSAKKAKQVLAKRIYLDHCATTPIDPLVQEVMVKYLRETAPSYIYSNPITPAEAGAARQALAILDSRQGLVLLNHMKALTKRFEKGLQKLKLETIAGEHPIVPLMVRDTARTAKLVKHLFKNGILATGLNFPVVPKGDQEIRFQISASHTEKDIDLCLKVLAEC